MVIAYIQRHSARVWVIFAGLGYGLFCFGFTKDDQFNKVKLGVKIALFIVFLILHGLFFWYIPRMRESAVVKKNWGRPLEFVVFILVQLLAGIPTLCKIDGSTLFCLAGASFWCLGFERAFSPGTDLNLTSIATAITFSAALNSWNSRKYTLAHKIGTFAFPLVIGIVHFFTVERTRTPAVLTLNVEADDKDHIVIDIPPSQTLLLRTPPRTSHSRSEEETATTTSLHTATSSPTNQAEALINIPTNNPQNEPEIQPDVSNPNTGTQGGGGGGDNLENPEGEGRKQEGEGGGEKSESEGGEKAEGEREEAAPPPPPPPPQRILLVLERLPPKPTKEERANAITLLSRSGEEVGGGGFTLKNAVPDAAHNNTFTMVAMKPPSFCARNCCCCK